MEKTTWLDLLKEPLEKYEAIARQKFEAETKEMVMDDPATAAEKAKDLIDAAAKYQSFQELLATHRQSKTIEEYFEKIKKVYQDLKAKIDWGMDVRDEAEVRAKYVVYGEVVEKVFSLVQAMKKEGNDAESYGRVYKIEFRLKGFDVD